MSFSHDDIQARIVKALQALKGEHASLLQAANMSEVGLAHYFTNALSKQFDGWDVDYDYSLDTIWPENSANSKKIYPDIVVHRRGNPQKRLLALELKKWGCPSKMIKRDREKLTEYLQQMDYQHAAFVFLPCMEGYEMPEAQMVFFHPPLKNKPAKTSTPPPSEQKNNTSITVTATKVAPSTPTKAPAKKIPEPIIVAQKSVSASVASVPQKVAVVAPAVEEDAAEEVQAPHSTSPVGTTASPDFTTQHAPAQAPDNHSDPQDQTSPNGLINEHLLSHPEPSPIIYPDQVSISPAPHIADPYASNSHPSTDKPRPILKSLGIDISKPAPVEDEILLAPADTITDPNDPYQSAPLHDFHDALQKMPKSPFPSRIYIEPAFWDEVPDPEDPMPQPQSKSEDRDSQTESAQNYQQN